MIKDHLYDAGWPRNDKEGCIATWTKDSLYYARSAHEVCGAPASSHEGTEYIGDPGAGQAGDMHEPPPYRATALDFGHCDTTIEDSVG